MVNPEIGQPLVKVVSIDQPAVNQWSSIKYVKHWSKSGQLLVNHWSTSGQPRKWSTQEEVNPQTGQLLVKHWSIIGQPVLNLWSTCGTPLAEQDHGGQVVNHWSNFVQPVLRNVVNHISTKWSAQRTVQPRQIRTLYVPVRSHSVHRLTDYAFGTANGTGPGRTH